MTDTEGEPGEEPEAPPKPPVVDGITAQDFALWRHQPITRMFLKYLRDRRADFAAGVTEQWLGGVVVLADEHEARGFCKCLGEVAATNMLQIATFYQQLQTLDEEAQHGDQDDTERTDEKDGGQGAPSS